MFIFRACIIVLMILTAMLLLIFGVGSVPRAAMGSPMQLAGLFFWILAAVEIIFSIVLGLTYT